MERKCSVCGEKKEEKEFDYHNADALRRQCRNCYNRLRRERRGKTRNQKEAPLIECKICGKQYRHINNTHLKRHNITIQEYKKKYSSEIFAKGLLAKQLKNRITTLNKRYTPEELKYLKGEKSQKERMRRSGMSASELGRKYWKGLSAERKIERSKELSKQVRDFYKELKKNPTDHKKHRKRRLLKRKYTNLQKYGVEFPQSLPETKAKVKNTKLEKYGDPHYHNPQKARETLKKNYGKYCNFAPRFSKTSQVCFKEIENELKNVKCFYAINGSDKETNEWQIYHHKDNKVRYLDFYSPKINLWIEFDEVHHKYPKNKEDDLLKERQVKDMFPNIILLRISETDWIENPKEVLKRVKKLLANNRSCPLYNLEIDE